MNNDLTIDKVLMFFKAFKGDEITFENTSCGNYTDYYSDIENVGISSLRVKVNSQYSNADCVDKDNFTDVSIDSIRQIINKNSPFREFEMDSKVGNLRAFLSKNRIHFKSSEQIALDDLLERFRRFFDEINKEGADTEDSVDRKIDRKRFYNLFIDLKNY
ncbi:hypothetical protein [Aequorivita capsosiphonis]|uniref:hypothetical protein n=1 Tax=Aequorivita capsosiphonis TaxID=487317 RepID=UPI0003FCBBA9|nr:hypothetical protein [Aequorivita capsosiphonis]